ncbi:hypothetical protein, variant [Spizellomyces punctatus DAOM BR117]|uniref:Uncharacterized protein n=1 Tax=Spizellomyces punctatus (strain DAOM BR117) TaxID=645134 RepID=A0A0L0HIX9_SPIPD|nr:hypothetical protein, variant [Spizellomyces punctatus DAOM BR117]KND00988.1 hypothetical protein, variant [Spizellomyces punctatus DAOM BR117]|eukprot:XP_016609027.1 hypothetical protein, variant [Spizellomyces punctatus DAOM BR117]
MLSRLSFAGDYSASLDAMGFGPELQEIKAVDQHVSEGIHFVSEVREFMRERAELEADFARRLEALAKKYAHRKDKLERDREKRASLISTAIPSNPGSPTKDRFAAGNENKEMASRDEVSTRVVSTTQKAWAEILHETEVLAKAHMTLHDALHADIADKLKALATKKEEARKKHIAFSMRLLAERDRLVTEKDKAKAKYDAASEAVEVAKNKHNRAPDDKTAEKLKKRWHEEIVDLNNTKNLYVLALAAANACKHKYYEEDIPKLLMCIKDLDISTTWGLKSIWQDYRTSRSAVMDVVIRSLGIVRAAVDSIDPQGDADTFVQSRGNWDSVPGSNAPDFPFLPSGLWKDNGELAQDDYAHVFLRNTLRKLQKRVDQIDTEIKSKNRTLDGTKNLFDAYTKDRKQGDPDDVKESMLDESRDIMVLKTARCKYQTQIDAIMQCIGEESPNARFHNLKGANFSIPTTCDYCHGTIWGVAKPGLTCSDCGYSAHLKCELKIPPECPGAKGARRPASMVSQRTSVTSIGSVLSASGSNWFVGASAYVLYDYSPAASAFDEIAVTEGSVVRIIEPDDGSGWTLVSYQTDGESRKGLVPTSYIELASPALAAESMLSERNRTPSPTKISRIQTTVAYDYTKGGDDELTVKAGQVVWITEGDDGSGWVTVNDGTLEGLVPASYLEPVQ